MKYFKVLFMVVVLLGAVMWSCGGQESQTQEEETKIPVKVATVELGNVIQSLTFNGDINAEFNVNVFSKVPDRIEEFYVDEGDFVRKGEPVARVFATSIEQGVRQAEAALTAARAQETNLRLEYERAKRLNRENAMSQQQFDTVETQYEAVKAQVEQAEAGLASAKSGLADATITAPITGVIGKRFLEAGDMAAPGTPLVSIVQMDRVKTTFDATETDLGRLALGQEARIHVKSYPDEEFVGTVSKISPILDPITRMAQVEVILDNPDKKLKPGMFAKVIVITGILDDVIAVPRYATIENTTLQRVAGRDNVVQKYFVFVVKDSAAIQRTLDVKYVNHVNIAVNAGLSVGEQLVVEGQNNLRDGVAVNIIEEESEL